MNKVILMGRLTKDPEIRYTASAEPTAVARYTLAVNRRFRREGEPDADFINCLIFGKGAEFAEKYFKRGQLVAVSGRLQIRTFDDDSGRRQWYTEVVLDDQHFAESRASFEGRSEGKSNQNWGGVEVTDSAPPRPSGSGSGGTKQPQQQSAPDSFFEIDTNLSDDDLPF